MAESSLILTRLRALIGRRVSYLQREYQIIEILDDGPSLVLLALGNEPVIQANMHGEACRRVPQTYTVSVHGSDGEGINPLIAGMGIGEIATS